MKPSDLVVLDSGYTPGENGIPFRIKEKQGEKLVGLIRGHRVEFHEWQAALVGSKRAKAIICKRELFNARRVKDEEEKKRTQCQGKQTKPQQGRRARSKG